MRRQAWLAARSGWTRAALALGLGALGALALPPWTLLPAFVIAFVGLAWLIDAARTGRQALLTGWLYGFGGFGASLAWLGNAFMVDAERFGAFALPALVGLAAGLALFTAAAAWLARLARPGLSRVFALALAWTALEWLRGHVLSGFPWNLAATVWAPFAAPSQAAAVVGAYGLGFATVLAAALPAAGVRAAVAGALLVGLLWGAGAARLPSGPADVVAGASLRIVQGNVAQHHKWRAELRQAHLARYVELSANAPGPRPKLLIWPESAVPYFLDEEPGLRARLGTLVAPGGVFVSGVVRRRVDDGALGAVWNSVMAVGETGEVIAVYDKARLVPFGEFMPLRAWLPFRKLTEGSVDFSAGPGLATWHLPGLPPASPLVCYEAIFPGAVTRPDDRPDWLLNVTNDAWFGASAGPYQHLAAARLRAIEEGLPLVRAANTGISVVTDAYGRVVAGLGLGKSGVIDAVLPAALEPTPYARTGDLVLLPMAMIAVGLIWLGQARDGRGKGLQL